jgi:hypothetical protein
MSAHEFKRPEDVDVPAGGLWAKLPIIGGVLAVIGLLGTFATIGTNRVYVLHSYLFAFAVVLSLALGCLGFVLIQHVVRAGWSVGIRRIAENGGKAIWIFALLFIPIAVFAHDIFPWTHEEHLDAILQKKAPYLNLPFFYMRSVVYLVCWIVLGFVLHRKSVQMDAGDPVRADTNQRFLWKFSSGGILVFGVTLSFASFDWLMSLQPHWYSTIFGVYYFAGAMLGFFAFLTLVVMGLQRAGMIKTAVTTAHYHDFGKYIFGFTIFWAYVSFSQFMLMWYANIPEETEFYYHRAHPDHGWAVLTYALPITNFFLPFFFLLSRHVKRNRALLAIAAVYILAVHALDLYWLVMPTAEITPGHFVHFPNPLLWVDVMALVGVAGAWLAAFGWHLNSNKVLAMGDPRLEESMAHENY